MKRVSPDRKGPLWLRGQLAGCVCGGGGMLGEEHQGSRSRELGMRGPGEDVAEAERLKDTLLQGGKQRVNHPMVWFASKPLKLFRQSCRQE